MLQKIHPSAKLTFLVLILFGCILGIGLFGVRSLNSMNQNTKTLYADRVLPLAQLTTIRYDYGVVILSNAQQVNSGAIPYAKALQQVQKTLQEISSNWHAYKLTYLTTRETELVKDAEKSITQGNELLGQMMEALKTGNTPALNTLVQDKLNLTVKPILYNLNKLIDLQTQVSRELYNNNNVAYKTTTKDFFVLIVTALVCALGLSYLIVGDNRRLFTRLETSNTLIAASEEKFRAFIENAGDAILIVDDDFRILAVNQSACAMSGYSREELTRMKTSDLAPSNEQELTLVKDELAENAAHSLQEGTLLTKDGQLLETESNVAILEGTGYIFIIRDVSEMRKTQKQVALSESTLRSAFDHSAIGMALTTPEGEFLKTNIALCNITGFSNQELLSMSFADITHPDDLEPDLEQVEKAKRGELESFSLEKRYIRKNGAVIWIKLNSSLVRDSNDHPQFFVGQIEDITATKSLTTQLAEKEFQYASLFNQALEYIAVLDNDGLIVDVNESLCKLTGLTREKLLTMRAEDLIEPENLQAVPIDYEVKPVGAMMITDRRIMKSSGEYTDVEVSRKQVDANRIMAIGRDTTERKRVAQQLKESEEKFRSIVEQSLVGIYIIQNATLVYVNPGFEKLFGYSKLKLLDKISFDGLVHPDDVNLVRNNYLQSLNKQQKHQYTFRGIGKDNQVIHLEAIVSLISYNNEPAVIGTLVDITDRVEEEIRISYAVLEAQENERLQIGMELHDNVKQILAGTGIYVEIVRNNLHDPVRANSLLLDIKKYNMEAIDELRRLSHQLAPLVESDTKLDDKITWLIRNLKFDEKLTVSVHVDEFLTPLHNETQLAFYRILQEQMSNILKYANASGVQINVSNVDHQIHLQIADDGKGFDLNAKKEGIGLENIRRRVQMLRGKVEIVTSPGNGCEVNVWIPAIDNSPLSPKAG